MDRTLTLAPVDVNHNPLPMQSYRNTYTIAKSPKPVAPSVQAGYTANVKEGDMPKGPQGQKRPGDVIGNAVHIARIATGEIEDSSLKQPAKRASGLAGAKARHENNSEAQRREIAERAAAARWG